LIEAVKDIHDGAMDFVHGAKKMIVVMEHDNKDSKQKMVKKCHLPLTGKRVVHRIMTEKAVIDVTEKGRRLVEILDGKHSRRNSSADRTNFNCR
jgi:3-oxoacid CoA-transferase subunit B